MSRRAPNPTADRAAQNQQTLKTLVKIESNKSCADCKRNKHPRWASWNLGIFVCIRCSGIHRGMGTHISRVKSVDLDAWTDEQLQSMIRWGNARANKYWEAKLAPGHVPAEAKMENFIRTKYDSKRWAMEGGIPDPATLDVGERHEPPLEAMQANAKVDRSTAPKVLSSSTSSQPATAPKSAQNVDIFGEDSSPMTGKSNSGTSAASFKPPPPPKSEVQAPKALKTGDSLLGFDFFNTPPPGPPMKSSSATFGQASSSIPSRPDLKQSILSLYASSSRTSTPTPQQSSAPAPPVNQASSTTFPNSRQRGPGGLDDAFSSLSFASPPSLQQAPPPSKPSNFLNIASPPTQTIPPARSNARLSGSSGVSGGFFNPKPAAIAGPDATLPSPSSRQHGFGSSNGFGDFTSATSPTWGSPLHTKAANESNDLFDFSSTAANTTSNMPPVSTSSNIASSPFNLTSVPKPAPAVGNTPRSLNTDPWGSNEAWASSNNAATPTNPPLKTTSTTSISTDVWNWGEASSNRIAIGPGSGVAQPAHIAGDEDFGGWESSTIQTSVPPGKPPNAPSSKPAGGFGGGDDLFSNVWE